MVEEKHDTKDIVVSTAPPADDTAEKPDRIMGSTESTNSMTQGVTLAWLKGYELDDYAEFDIVNTVEDLAMATQVHSAVADFLLPSPPTPPPPLLCIEVQTEQSTEDNAYTSIPIILRPIFMGEAPDEEKMNVLHKLGEIDSIWLNGCSVANHVEDDRPRIISTQISHHPFRVESMDCRWSATPDTIIDYLLERTGLDTQKPSISSKQCDLDMVVYFYDSDPAKLERVVKMLKLFNSIHTAVLLVQTKTADDDESNHESHKICQEALQEADIRFLQLVDNAWIEQPIQPDKPGIYDVEHLLNANRLEDLIWSVHTINDKADANVDENAHMPEHIMPVPPMDLRPPISAEIQTLPVTEWENDNSSRSLKSPALLLLTILTFFTVWLSLIEEDDIVPDKLSVKWLNLSMDTSVPYFQAKLNPMWTTLDPVDHTHYFVVELYDHSGQRLPGEIGQDEVVDAVISKQTRVSGETIEEYEVVNVPHLERGLYGVEVASPCYLDSVEEIRVELWLSEYDIQVDGSPITLTKDTCTGYGAGTRATEPVILKRASSPRSSQIRPSNPDWTSGGHILFSTKTSTKAASTHTSLFQKWFRAFDSFLSSIMDYFTKATLPSYRFLPQQAETENTNSQ